MRHLEFLDGSIDINQAYSPEYNIPLVIFSYFIASLAGYIALTISSFVKDSIVQHNYLWLISGSIVMGCGIWAMHFVGMLAYNLPIAINYDIIITLVSVLPAIIASGIAIYFISFQEMTPRRLLLNGLIFGGGIGAMHYTGMAAMRLNALMVYDPYLFFLSVFVAWVLASCALYVRFYAHKFIEDLHFKYIMIISAIFIGLAVGTMHYTAMFAAYFFPAEGEMQNVGADNQSLAFGIISIIVIILSCFILIINFQKKLKVVSELADLNYESMIEAVENMSDGFILCDGTKHIQLCNQLCYKMFGKWNEHQLLAIKLPYRTFCEYVVENYIKSENSISKKELIHNLVCGEFNHNGTYFETINGEWLLLRQKATNRGGMMHIWTDVSNIKHTEFELVQLKDEAIAALDKLKQTQTILVESEKMASLGSLVAGVAHEINTPLGVSITAISSIQSEIEDVQKKLAGASLKKMELVEKLDYIMEGLKITENNLDRVVNLVRDFKKISVDQQLEEVEEFNLREAIERIVHTLSPRLKKTNVQINLDIPDDIWLVSLEGIFFQIISNLITNSIAHGFDDMKNMERKIVIRAHSSDGRLFLNYSDNGKGVDPVLKDNIFEPFVTTKRNKGGTGLGLNIVYNLISQRLKGKISLQDKIEKSGATFNIEAPLNLDQNHSIE